MGATCALPTLMASSSAAALQVIPHLLPQCPTHVLRWCPQVAPLQQETDMTVDALWGSVWDQGFVAGNRPWGREAERPLTCMQ